MVLDMAGAGPGCFLTLWLFFFTDELRKWWKASPHTVQDPPRWVPTQSGLGPHPWQPFWNCRYHCTTALLSSTNPTINAQLSGSLWSTLGTWDFRALQLFLSTVFKGLLKSFSAHTDLPQTEMWGQVQIYGSGGNRVQSGACLVWKGKASGLWTVSSFFPEITVMLLGIWKLLGELDSRWRGGPRTCSLC